MSTELKRIEVFTDGASSKNGRAGCKSGSGVYFPATDKKVSVPSEQKLRDLGLAVKESNNVGELLAIVIALDSVDEEDRKTTDLVVYSDSMYCIQCVSVWYKKWETNGWKTAKGDVKNQELIKKILDLKNQFHSVFFVHVNSHMPEPHDRSSHEWSLWNGNNVADKLASESICP